MHRQQAEEKRAALQEASAVDDMYEMLSVYEQKTPIGDQVTSRRENNLSAVLLNQDRCC